MSKLIGIAIASACLQLLSIDSIILSSTPNNITIPISPQRKTSSWQEKFDKKRRETEFLDDEMEKLLRRNKAWIVLMISVFVWMTYKSLWSSK